MFCAFSLTEVYFDALENNGNLYIYLGVKTQQ